MLSISFVLPCYNVEKYISECLDSIYNQDIPETMFEVICVNDCSPDSTRDIIREYQKQHSNLLLIDHEVNKKQGGARNTGLKAARGKYIWFVDPDDYLEKKILKQLLNEVDENDLDILFFDYKKFTDDVTDIQVQKVKFMDGVVSGKTIFSELNFWDVTSLSWLRIVRRDFLINQGIFFYNDFFMEDVIYGILCFLKAERTKYIPIVCYYYRVTPNSVMNSTLGGIKTASYLKLGLEYYLLSEQIEDKKLSDHFVDISRFYLNSVVKPIIYLNYKEKLIFYSYILKIKDIDIYKKISDNRMLNLELNSQMFKYLLFIISPILILLKRCR